MMYLDLDVYCEILSDRDSPEAINIRIAQQTFTDLTIYRGPDETVYYCSVAANPFVDKLDFKHDDAGRTYVTAFTVDKGIKVYSDPPMHYVGRYNVNGFGETQDPDWAERLLACNWEDDSIDKVKDYFRQHPPIDF